ncbi:MAG: DUF5107 domain-containing protein, partial [Bacteroidetes bacterium]|nr:DUF5107 domain-containing protein [Bacteroidota bacterium]
MKALPLNLFILVSTLVIAQHPAATVKENVRTFRTYPFSDPDPVARTGMIYPYFRFDGYTNSPEDKGWKVVELENEFIRVMILPEIGGKIWAAIDKTTGKSFVYYNHVVKFRDIAMRGPWTSGGIEPNYGIIGHTPNTATPVDYLTKQNDDGSVSCFIGTLDLLTLTYWTIEINLPRDKAYFTTRSFWHNGTPLEQPYYTWMNVGMPAQGGLQFAYPGYQYLGHGGDHHSWPNNERNGKNLSIYDQNNFGSYKSYHVFGTYTDFFGAYYHKEHFGMARFASHDEKPGKKIWIWGLSPQGMIWEKLLSDTDGQYVEIQSGRLFNQTAGESTLTPFKHRGFAPYATDDWTEYWFPVGNTGGIVKANPFGALNVSYHKGRLSWYFSPAQELKEEWIVKSANQVLYKRDLDLKTMKVYKDSIAFSRDLNSIVVSLGGKKFEYHADTAYGKLQRPLESPEGFDWQSAQGLYIKGKEHIRAREYEAAMTMLEACISKDPNFLPALTELASLHFRNYNDQKALSYASHALSIDTYDAAANYYYGLIQTRLGRDTDARDGFDIASANPEFRSASYLELGRSYFREGDYSSAEKYLRKSLNANGKNIEAIQAIAILQRITRNPDSKTTLQTIKGINPLNHFARAEEFLAMPSDQTAKEFTSMIRNEMPLESYLQLAGLYTSLQLWKDAIGILKAAPNPNAEVFYWMAWLQMKIGDPAFAATLEKANAQTVEFVFPFRSESIPVFQWAIEQTGHWKPKYFLALLHAAHRNNEAATSLLANCGNQPDFAAFYAFRAGMIKSTTIADLEKAATMDPQQWRYGKLMVGYHMEHNDLKAALDVSTRYYSRFPSDFRMQSLHARVLLLNGKHKECLEVLSQTNILPFEGATESRQLYHEAQLIS